MSILDNVKEVTGLIQKIDNIDLYRKILDLQAEILEVVQENRDLREKIDALASQIKTKETLVFQKSVYLMKNSDGTMTGPYCPSCWDGKERLVRLVDYGGLGTLQCSVCDKYFDTNFRPT